MSPSAPFWQGKRVLVTGHTGFKGAWLFHWLTLLGAVPHGFALAPETEPNLAWLTGIADGPRSTIGDVRDVEAIGRAMREFAPDIVLHLAAQALVRRSYRDPLESFSTNVMGTLEVLKAASEVDSVGAIVVVTTDKCYENKEWIWPYRENEALGGHDPYSASKACTEIATAAWRSSLPDMGMQRSTPLPRIATARAGNVFGGGDWADDRLVPDFFRSEAAGRQIVIRSPNARRPWQHVLEPLCGYLLLAERLWTGEAEEAWNFGPDLQDVRSVRYLVEHLFGTAGNSGSWILAEGHQPHEATSLALDASKARERLGWHPRLRLEPALEWTAEWYRRHAAGAPALDLTVEQITRYAAMEG